MEKQAKEKIVIVGCGNVAWHLAKHLVSLKKFQVHVYNHKKNPALDLFRTQLKCSTQEGLNTIIGDASVYFICVTDKFISSVAEKIPARNPAALLVHTSGSAKREDLGERLHATAVLYPLQSFSKHAVIDWKQIPFIVEAADKAQETRAKKVAGLFSKQIVTLDYQSRLHLHLAAVFVNNFVNALYVSASDLLRAGLQAKTADFALLLPLIEQTTAKIRTMDPRAAQTGPAKRRDESVMKKHRKLLSKDKELHKLYRQFSKLIVKQQQRSHA